MTCYSHSLSKRKYPFWPLDVASSPILHNSCSCNYRALYRDLDARVRLWLVRAWFRIPFAAIFADISRGWFKLM